MGKTVSGRHTGETHGGEQRLSRASVGRFSLYLRHLERFHNEGLPTVSSVQLGEALGITDAQVRKDLAYLGHLGQPGIGYPVKDLRGALRHKLGLDRTWAVAVVGIGNLARALLRHRAFQQQGFRFVALLDADPEKIGQVVEGLTIQAARDMAAVVAAGIRGILNFAPAVLRLPARISLVSVDLAVQLEQLAFLVHLDGAE